MSPKFILLAYNKSGEAYVLINLIDEHLQLQSFIRFYKLPLPADYKSGEEVTETDMASAIHQGDFIYPPPEKQEFYDWNTLLDCLESEPIDEKSIRDAQEFVLSMPADWIEECINDIRRNELRRFDKKNNGKIKEMCELLTTSIGYRAKETELKAAIDELYADLRKKQRNVDEKSPAEKKPEIDQDAYSGASPMSTFNDNDIGGIW